MVFSCALLENGRGATPPLTVGYSTTAVALPSIGPANVDITLTATTGAEPAGLDFTLAYAAGSFSSLTITAAAGASAVGKQVTCTAIAIGQHCMVYGANTRTLGNGPVATVTLAPASGVHSATVQLSTVVAATPSGEESPVGISPGAFTVTVATVPFPAPTALRCAASTFTTPGAFTCEVTLSTAAPAGGLSLTLSSDNSAATVPATMAVPGGLASASFVVTASAVQTVATVRLSAAASGSTVSDTVVLMPPAPCTYSLSTSTVSAPAAGISTSLALTASAANCTWSATSSAPSWLLLNTANGTGSASVNYSVAPNSSVNSRSASLTIAGQPFTVVQGGLSGTVSLSSSALSVGHAATNGTINVTANASDYAWSAFSSAPAWLSITSGASGLGSGTVAFSISANSGSQSRSATITIAGQTVAVVQSGVACSFVLSASSANIPAAANTGSVILTASATDCAWTASSSAPAWLTVATTSGTGSATIPVSAAQNNSINSRTAVLTLGGQSLTVTQSGAAGTISVSPPSINAPASMNTGAITVTTNVADLAWSASSSAANWLVITNGTSGVGSGTISYSMGANPDPQTRTAFLSVNGQTVQVTQASVPAIASCQFALSTTVASLGVMGGTGTLTLSAPSYCSWNITGDTSWSTFSPSSGTGAATITYSAGVNNGRARSTQPLIGDQAFTLAQAGRTVESIGIFRDGLWLLDANGSGQWEGTGNGKDSAFFLGQSGDTPLRGDWNGSGTKKAGVFRNGLFVLDYNGNAAWDGAGVDRVYSFGRLGDTVIVGDWSGDGRDKLGIFRDGVFYLDTAGNGTFNGVVVLGASGDTPVIGDWNGTGTQKVGIFRSGLWVLDFNGNGKWDGLGADTAFYLGGASDMPLTGDWNGDGRTKVGVFRAGLWVLDYNGNGAWDGPAVDRALFTGTAGDTPVVGDWTGDGKAKAGVFRQGHWWLDETGDGSFTRPSFLGQAGDSALAGRW